MKEIIMVPIIEKHGAASVTIYQHGTAFVSGPVSPGGPEAMLAATQIPDLISALSAAYTRWLDGAATLDQAL